ncbi:hypothetical protein BpHYR1_040748 [Brachionus plicatilis]|uniref:Uncharacterized protein n=1 Tax=Brachionus plicatilis TaxID=10195 RepID=A0A3M7PU38_BRAPC|nr:hypothetical protein BpHYR1_040748 [Brachionus plicatilis]
MLVDFAVQFNSLSQNNTFAVPPTNRNPLRELNLQVNQAKSQILITSNIANNSNKETTNVKKGNKDKANQTKLRYQMNSNDDAELRQNHLNPFSISGLLCNDD